MLVVRKDDGGKKKNKKRDVKFGTYGGKMSLVRILHL